MQTTIARLIAAALAASAAAAGAQGSAEPPVLNIYNWSDYVADDTIRNFEKETGIKVRYDNYDNNEILHAKLVAGKTGYDIVVPGAHFAKMQIEGGLLQKLDRSLLPNWKNLDPVLLEQMAKADPGNQYLVDWLWGYVTVGINEGKVKAALGGAALPSNPWDLIFKPEIAARLKGCGVNMLDSASEVMPVAMVYAAKDPYSRNARDYDAARDVLAKARPSITRFSSSGYINDLAAGSLCVVMGYSGDINIARQRAIDTRSGQTIRAMVPPSGASLFFDSMAIPKDAPHPKNAHRFIDYILRPQVHAALTNKVFYANPNAASKQYVAKAVAENPTIFLSAADMKKLTPPDTVPQDIRRVQTRIFTTFKAGGQVTGPADVLGFWFGAPPLATRKAWFQKDDAFDGEIRGRFGALVEAAIEGGLAREWTADAPLATILLLDQFTRNAYRGTARAFAGDERALALAQKLVGRGDDRRLQPVERLFVYLPYEHAEDLAAQDDAVRLIGALAAEDASLAGMLDYAHRHRDVIRRFGRFPHRNAALGRSGSADGSAYVQQPGSGF